MVHRGNRAFHDRVAARYDDVYAGPYWRFYRDVSWRHLKPFLPRQRPAWAADLGCGTGWFGARLLRSRLSVLFLDPSANMLERARATAEGEVRGAVATRYLQAGLEDMAEVADGTLDFATAQGDPLSFCDDPRRALRELHRCVKPGGFVVLSVDSRVGGVRSELEAGRPAEALELLRTGRTSWRGERSDERFPMKMFDPDELDGLLRHAGFEPRSRIAKTCLVQRRDAACLEDEPLRRRLLAAEERVHAQPHWFALAAHFQVAAQRC